MAYVWIINFPHHHIIKLEMVPSPYGVLNPLAELQEFFFVGLMFFNKKKAVLIELHGIVSKAASLLQLVVNKTRQYLKEIFDGHMTKECTAKDNYCLCRFHFT
jgi:hypothetical protein